jgi:hypothetical protein
MWLARVSSEPVSVSRPCCSDYPFGQCYSVTVITQAISAWAVGETASHMASEVKIERDKFVVRKLDPCYQNRLQYAESAAEDFVKSQEEFQQIFRKAKGSGSVPPTDKDYNALSKADGLKGLVDRLQKLDDNAGVCLSRINSSPTTMEQYIEDDADIIVKACAVELRGMIEEKEEQIATLQKDVAALKRDLAAISKTIATALKSEVDPILDEAEKLKTKFGKPSIHPLGFNRFQKDLQAALKKNSVGVESVIH